MRALEDYIETGDRTHLEQFCLRERPRLAALVRKFKIDGYDLDDLTQEAFLAALTWAEDVRAMRPVPQDSVEAAILAHLYRARDRQRIHSPKKTTTRSARGYDPCELPQDDIRARTDSDLEALVLLWAVQSECESDEEESLLSMLVEGSGYQTICGSMCVNLSCAKMRVNRLRARLYGRVYETEGAG